MSKSVIELPKSIDPAEAPAMAAEILRVWDVDLEAAGTADANAALEIAERAIENGRVAALIVTIERRAMPREISRMVARLLGCWPKEGVDLSILAEMMAGDIGSLQPCLPALESAAEAVRRKSLYRPSIAEVFAAVKEHQEAWEARAGLLARLPARVAEVRALASPGRAA